MQKTVFITGATGGLGTVTAHAFANLGYRVAVGYNNSLDKANTLVSELTGDGHIAVKCTTDNTPSVQQARDIIATEFGSLTALVNNAGWTKFVPHNDLKSLDDDLMDGIFKTNVRGAFACVREMEDLLQQGSCIINISSIAGQTGNGSNIAYCASKAALDTITKSLARVLAPKIRVIAIAPGLVDTEFVKGLDKNWRNAQENATPMKRLADPEEVANAITACVEHMTFTTGRTIYIDGGRPLETL